MKVSDYTLDLVTGNATFADAYEREAQAILECAVKDFEIAEKIYNADEVLDDVVFEFVFGKDYFEAQNSAKSTEWQKSIASKKGQTAVIKAITGLYKACVASGSKISSLISKQSEYLNFLSKTGVVSDCSCIHISGKNAIKLAAMYTKLVAYYLNALGYHSGKIFEDGDVKACVGSWKHQYVDMKTVKDINDCFEDGYQCIIKLPQIKMENGKVTQADVKDLLTACKCVEAVAKQISNLEIGGIQATQSLLIEACQVNDDDSKRRKGDAIHDFMKNSIDWNAGIIAITKQISEFYRESISKIATEARKARK